MDRLRIAYLMGHQATASVDRYGNRKSAKGGRLPNCPADADLSHIRVTHILPSADKKSYIQSITPIVEVELNEDLSGSCKPKGMVAFINRKNPKDDGFSR
jgi:hypothetical protein